MAPPHVHLPSFHRLVRLLTDVIRENLDEDVSEQAKLRVMYDHAVAARRTSVSWAQWRDEKVEQVAIAWLLGTLFVRYAEDNAMIDTPKPSGDLRQWWLSRFSTLAVALSTAPGQLAPADTRLMPEEGAQILGDFWQQQDNGGKSLLNFTDPDLDTRFLGDLYQEVSEPARHQYALLQTPAFIEEFILDQTLEPAVEQFGLDELAVLDPVCGSGNFVLGTFARLLKHWAKTAPNMPDVERVRRALTAVHGVDLNPFAAAITRFRLLVAARRACGNSPAPDIRIDSWPLRVAIGDSLLGDGDELNEDPDLLAKGKYHVVVGNPPYITVKDRAVDQKYRQRYDSCVGKYSLVVPFIQRFFELALRGDERSAGYVGLLAANSFTKREFGRRLAEEILTKRVTLNKVIDTSGAHIPGHGTPTIILVGRNRPAIDSDQVLVVAGLRGEPSAPAAPGEGAVWQSILRHADRPNQSDNWTESLTLDHVALRSFPWQLSGRQPAELMQLVANGPRLGDLVSRISYLANTGADDIFTASHATWRRQHTEAGQVFKIVSGSDIRDWAATPARSGFFPRTADLQVINIDEFPGHRHRLWPYRTTLGNRSDFSGRSYFNSSRIWYDWHSVSGAPTDRLLRIAFAWVATHPHFASLENAVALPSAPVIELTPQSSPAQRAHLVAALNSSTVCFWLKQISQRKGVSSVHKSTGGSGEPWAETYEFTPGRLRELPIPTVGSTRYGEELERLASALAASTPAAVLAFNRPTAESLREARDRWTGLRSRMIALAEEQDWEIYSQYGLLPDPRLAPDTASIPDLRLGERAFEIILARKILASEGEETQWFARHGSVPVQTIPEHWPAEYRALVEARIKAITSDPHLKVLERPEYKRRWATAGWDAMQQQALRDWLLDQCEYATLWFDTDGRHRKAQLRSINSLSEALRSDASVTEAAALYAPDKDLAEVLRDLLLEESVPCLAASRYTTLGLAKWKTWKTTWRQQRDEDDARAHGDSDAAQKVRQNAAVPPKYVATDFRKPSYWRSRGKYDVPSERFVSFPMAVEREPDLLLGWSGWSHTDRILALTSFIEERLASGDTERESLIPLIAAAHELLERADDTTAASRRDNELHRLRIGDWMGRLRLNDRDLGAWRPKSPKRGRPRKRPTT
ncbi:BREX-2 system adenine-specific DNA-methyltransferase PglX [Micromonospora sp. NPDC005305]|uniref:BREX-2 system adenine-specific DNA-methyltransferase PglX n=1 Tax=Micromonospora sp. NPDC005305 TaxID=3156875 RepID=UPI0033A87215